MKCKKLTDKYYLKRIITAFGVASLILGNALFANAQINGTTPGSSLPGQGNGGVVVGGEPGTSEPQFTCREELESYKLLLTDGQLNLPAELVEAIRIAIAADGTCEAKLAAVKKLIDDYWATEPWCKSDRESFAVEFTDAVKSKLPESALATVNALISRDSSTDTLSCSDTFYAAITVVKLYEPTFFVFQGDKILIGGGSADTAVSSREVISTVADAGVYRARATKAKRKLKQCTSKLKRK